MFPREQFHLYAFWGKQKCNLRTGGKCVGGQIMSILELCIRLRARSSRVLHILSTCSSAFWGFSFICFPLVLPKGGWFHQRLTALILWFAIVVVVGFFSGFFPPLCLTFFGGSCEIKCYWEVRSPFPSVWSWFYYNKIMPPLEMVSMLQSNYLVNGGSSSCWQGSD